MNKINVLNSYNVTVGNNTLEDTDSILKALNIKGKIAIVSDSNVAPLYLKRLESIIKDYSPVHYIFPAGESSKNIATLSNILEFFAESGLTRQDTVIALGGGVTGDMSGFAAGVYMRGIKYVQIPTTLLACVDSSVGGKTAIDLEAGKNLAGLFIQPQAVICDTSLLSTLTPKIYSDGMAEVIKTAILGDKELFEFLENPFGDANEYIVSHCVAYKSKIVTEDEFEMGVRKLLNLGHTPAHSIEKLSGYTISHGSAVAIGLSIMARSSYEEGLIDCSLKDRIINLIKKYSLPTTTQYSAKELADTAFYDKKRQGDKISLIKIRGIGDCFIEQHRLNEVEDIFARGM